MRSGWPQVFDRYTDRSRRAIVLSQEHARELGHREIDADHLLLGLAAEGGGVAHQALERAGVTAEDIWAAIAAARPPDAARPGCLPFTGEAKRALEGAREESLKLGHSYIGTEHLLLGLLAGSEVTPGSPCAQLLEACGAVTPAAVRESVMTLLRGYGQVPAASPAAGDDPRMAAVAVLLADIEVQLADIGRNLRQARELLGLPA